jgi:hypothetical protein
VGLTQRFAPTAATSTFDQDPAMRATGLAFGIVAYLLFITARLTATGARRLLGRLAGVGFALAAAVRLVGVRALLDSDALLPLGSTAGMRALVAGVALLAASAYVYLSSPARHR